MIRSAMACAVLCLVTASVQGATFTVTTTADSGPGSLRQAILDSNANGIEDSDTITFAIPGTGPHVITPTSGLPGIATRNITIDGYTQPGSSPNTRTPAQGGLDSVIQIVLSGSNFGNAGFGLTFNDFGSGIAGTRTVRGIAFNRFEGQIRFLPNDPDTVVALLVVEGCYFGTDAAGVAVPPLGLNGSIGIDAANPVRIGGLLPAQRNLFAGPNGNNGNSGIGMRFAAKASGVVQGNLIGTTRSGTARQGYAIGILVDTKTSAADLVIGGSDPNARNVISGGVENGIRLQNFGTILLDRVIVQGNFIGTDVTGQLPLPNGVGATTSPAAGISRVQNLPGSTRVIIGGALPGEANRIAFNTGPGIRVASNFTQAGNFGTVVIGENQIFANTGIPFDIADFPRANDPGDADEATNRLQNYPTLPLVTWTGNGGIDVQVQVDTAVANATYPLRVDLYRANEVGDPLGIVHSLNISAAEAQSVRSVSFSSTQPLGFLTAIATDAAGNASEFADVVDIDKLFRDGLEVTP